MTNVCATIIMLIHRSETVDKYNGLIKSISSSCIIFIILIIINKLIRFRRTSISWFFYANYQFIHFTLSHSFIIMFAYICYGKHKIRINIKIRRKKTNGTDRFISASTTLFRIGSVIALPIKRICWLSYHQLSQCWTNHGNVRCKWLGMG